MSAEREELERLLDRLLMDAHVPTMNRIRDLFAALQAENARQAK